MDFWREHRGFLLFSLCVILLLGVAGHFAAQRQTLTSAEEFVVRAFSPLVRVTNNGVQRVSQVYSDIRHLLSLTAENRALHSELASLRMRFNFLVEAERENERLRTLLNYQQENRDMDLMLAKVIGVSNNPWQQEIIIDRGSEHGVAQNMAIITHEGFVGRVYEVAPTTSKVILVLDPRGPVAAQVQESRVRGTIEGDTSEPGSLRLIRLPREADVRPGYTVVTAGTGGLNLLRGVVVGTVESVTVTVDGLQQIAAVRPAVSFNELEEVLVVRRAGGR